MHTGVSNKLLSTYAGASVVVTGGCGFIGSHLVEAVAALGAHVWVLDNLRAGLLTNLEGMRDSVCIETGDVRDAVGVKAFLARSHPAIVFHLAANASVPGSVDDPAYDFETNSLGTFTVLNALREVRVPARVVLASSGAIYGQPCRFPITESAPIDPISPYGASKASAEMVAKVFSRVFDLPVVTARIFNTYGPRMARFVILDFLRKLHHDPSVLEILGNGEQMRDFTYVSDTVQGLLLLGAFGHPSEAYNVSSGTSLSITAVARALIAALDLKEETRLTYTGSSWPGDAQRWEVNILKLRGLGYTPRVTLEEGLADTIQWYQKGIGVRDIRVAA